MSKEKRKSCFNIAVVGLSGTEQIKGSSGVGKSCLCNRFVREEADAYYPDHTSVLSQSDFGGRVVNNDHFLYWGDVIKKDDNGLEYKFNVIEQTEFIDDQSYQAHRSSSNQVYFKRIAQTKISSAEKMMYICTDQLGIESDFEAKPMSEGKLTIDGFILCFDVSHVTNRTVDDQVRFVQNCYHYLAKTKKPVLVVLTKCDEAVPAYAEEGERFAASVGGRKSGALPVMETSASENINVSHAFLLLAQMIDKTRSRSKIVSFEDAARLRKEVLKDTKEHLESLLESSVTDYHEKWTDARRDLVDKPQYIRFVEMEGKNAASKVFRKHVNRLRDEFRLNAQNEYLRFFPRALKMILSDPGSLRGSWKETLDTITCKPEYSKWIVSLNDFNGVGGPAPVWYEHPHMESLEDRRIPDELLQTADAERYFLFHKQELEAKQRLSEIKSSFRDALSRSKEVKPGRAWYSVAKFFKQESLSEINEAELLAIYDQFQLEIIEKAKENFQELLYEKSEIFVVGRNATQMDIQAALKNDARYSAMEYLQKEAEEILSRHISEALYPPPDNWGPQCLAFALKSHRARLSRNAPDMSSPALRWQLRPDSDTLNVVLLGADGLSHELANEITVHSSDEYTLDGCTHPLRLRSVDGDVTLPANSFKTSSFSPHGCIAVYSSMESLSYVEMSLEATVVSLNGPLDTPPPFQGLPVSILLASYTNSEKEIHKLRDAGERLASRIGCPFIDVLAPEYAYNRRFHESQIRMAMTSLIRGIKERAGSCGNRATDADRRGASEGEPDLRVAMCTRKGDFETAEMALAPLLNHASFRDGGLVETEGEETADSVVVETYLGMQRQCIEITVTSYQCARNLLSKKSPIHGFILVYDTTLKSSFSVMKVFAANTASSYPMLLLCTSPDEKRPAASFFQHDPGTRRLVVDGNKLADQLGAKFVSASSRHRHQTEVYSTFFKEAWEHKEDTESVHILNQVVLKEGSGQSTDTSRADSPALSKADSSERLADSSLGSTTPPSTLHVDAPAQSSFLEERCDVTTPGQDWNARSGARRAETPSTSPTAGLLDNMVDPGYSDDFEPKPTISSHLYPARTGRLNPDLVNKVAMGFRKPPTNLPDVLQSMRSASDPPYMAIHDQPKVGAVRVLPPAVDRARPAGDSRTPKEPKNDVRLPRASGAVASVRYPGKRAALKSVDGDPPPPPARPTRHSTADVLSPSSTDIDGCGLSKRSFAGSQEDLLGLQDRSTQKEKLAAKKAKEDERRRKEEKKTREKEQRLRQKQKNPPRTSAPPLATGNKHTISDYFNKPLDDIIQSLNHMVPLFPEKCVSFIENAGLRTEGLYRIPANAKERETIIRRFDEDNNYDLSDAEASVHTVAGCLTWFFSHKNLPDPLIPLHLHDELEEALRMPAPSTRNLAIRGIVRKLPHSNYATYKFICTHLKKVSDHSSENKMTGDNLAICWWNTLFRPELENAGMPKTFHKEILSISIAQCGFIFYDKQEV